MYWLNVPGGMKPVPCESLTGGLRAFGWKEGRERPKQTIPVARGVGVAACLWGIEGGPPGTVILKLLPDGSASLNMGAIEIGGLSRSWPSVPLRPPPVWPPAAAWPAGEQT